MLYKLIKTEDASYSIYSEEYREAMHTISGAYEESLLKHIFPSCILSFKNEVIRVLDIGFGIGYNVLALIMEFLKSETQQQLQIISFEKNLSYLPFMKKIHFADDRDCIYKNVIIAFETGEYISQRFKYKINLIYGDARQSIKGITNNFFDAVFHDPFSPPKNPELWTVEFFREVYRLIADYGVLTTYSSAPQIRMALLNSGLRVGMCPYVGRKKEGTLATKYGRISYFGDDYRMILKTNRKSLPYRDYFLKDSREDILKRRVKGMMRNQSK